MGSRTKIRDCIEENIDQEKLSASRHPGRTRLKMVLRLQSVEDSVVGRLGLSVVVEQQRGLVGAPGL